MNRALNDGDMRIVVQQLAIRNFRGIFMRDQLPTKPLKNECGIMNLDSIIGSGTHWVAYWKKGELVIYFDSFGNLTPPIEFVNYMNKFEIFYNREKYQDFNSINCGHLCLKFLFEMNKKKN